MKLPAAVGSFSNILRNGGSRRMDISKYMPVELNATGIEFFPILSI